MLGGVARYRIDVGGDGGERPCGILGYGHAEHGVELCDRELDVPHDPLPSCGDIDVAVGAGVGMGRPVGRQQPAGDGAEQRLGYRNGVHHGVSPVARPR